MLVYSVGEISLPSARDTSKARIFADQGYPNKEEVLNTCLLEHCAPPTKNLDLKLNSLPIDRALRIHWDVAQTDTFNLVVCDKPQPET